LDFSLITAPFDTSYGLLRVRVRTLYSLNVLHLKVTISLWTLGFLDACLLLTSIGSFGFANHQFTIPSLKGQTGIFLHTELG